MPGDLEGRECGFGRNTPGVDRCGQPAAIYYNREYVCEKHFRFRQMRRTAKECGKLVPSVRQLELLVPPEMRCPKCLADMVWRVSRYESRKRVISLQHYNDGTISLECMSCNQFHGTIGYMPDEHALIPDGMKSCPRCQQVLPPEAFYNNKVTYCRECSAAYYADNREICLARQRAYRVRHKDRLNRESREKRAARRVSQ